MFVDSVTPGPSPASVRFRADRVLAVRGPPYGTTSPWAELLFVGGGDSLVVAEEVETITQRISDAVEAQRSAPR